MGSKQEPSQLPGQVLGEEGEELVASECLWQELSQPAYTESNSLQYCICSLNTLGLSPNLPTHSGIFCS